MTRYKASYTVSINCQTVITSTSAGTLHNHLHFSPRVFLLCSVASEYSTRKLLEFYKHLHFTFLSGQGKTQCKVSLWGFLWDVTWCKFSLLVCVMIHSVLTSRLDLSYITIVLTCYCSHWAHQYPSNWFHIIMNFFNILELTVILTTFKHEQITGYTDTHINSIIAASLFFLQSSFHSTLTHAA